MTPAEALAMSERALRRGMCSAHRIADVGCTTCKESERAIKVLADLDARSRAEGYAEGVIAEREHTSRAIAERDVQRRRAEAAERHERQP